MYTYSSVLYDAARIANNLWKVGKCFNKWLGVTSTYDILLANCICVSYIDFDINNKTKNESGENQILHTRVDDGKGSVCEQLKWRAALMFLYPANNSAYFDREKEGSR
jgi:hypothetical protein